MKIKCIYNKNWSEKLTLGKIYDCEILHEIFAGRDQDWYSFVADDGWIWWSPSSWFEIVE